MVNCANMLSCYDPHCNTGQTHNMKTGLLPGCLTRQYVQALPPNMLLSARQPRGDSNGALAEGARAKDCVKHTPTAGQSPQPLCQASCMEHPATEGGGTAHTRGSSCRRKGRQAGRAKRLVMQCAVTGFSSLCSVRQCQCMGDGLSPLLPTPPTAWTGHPRCDNCAALAA